MVKIGKNGVLVLSRAEFGADVSASSDILEIVASVNGKAASFTYSGHDLVRLAKIGEKRLDKAKLPQSERPGFAMQACSAGPSANSYKYAAIGSAASLRRTTKGWVLTSFEQTRVYPRNPESIGYRGTPQQVQSIRDRAVADIGVIVQKVVEAA